ncbi:MAG: ROK family protein [Candidatus Omnitrophica bacterium]|nr:ROK family protein [Candidatus Omnitrophota bacterium]
MNDYKPSECAIGIDLGGTGIKAGVVSPEGQILGEWRIDTEAEKGGDHVLTRMLDLCEKALSELPEGFERENVAGVGIGAPGVFDFDTGVLISGAFNLPGFEGTPLREVFEKETGLPTRVDNDANVFALAESRWGAGKGTRHMIAYTLGTGVGGGVVINGKVFHGGWGFAGELGHVTVEPEGELCNTGNRGSLEMYASASHIANYAKRLVKEGRETSLSNIPEAEITCKAVGEAAEAGDALAQEIIERAGYYLAIGIAAAVIVVNPEIVVIGGGGALLGERLFQPIREGLLRRVYHQPVRPVPVVPAKFGTDSGIIGAGALAFSEQEEKQSAKERQSA